MYEKRVNIHLCLLNCNESRINVAGQTKQYFDGSFFAFEDRAAHEIVNEGGKERIKCPFYLKGSCKKGADCNMIHDDEEQGEGKVFLTHDLKKIGTDR